ncbi:hypothetical protein [Halorhabdus tiamatea]|uniref:hypothetical protein n=1 Tax=Halorhabdus tiamatea TaxID=430914 RepID=UPI0012691A38|nr:hypothetical protein [Halorhabdus tiamatea]
MTYFPEDRVLKSVNRERNVTLAEGDDILKIRRIEFPKPAPVAGTLQEDVEATVFYRSNQSGNIKSKTLTVSSIEGAGNKLRLFAEDDSKTYDILTDRNRRIKHRYGDERTIGRVVRVEFPEGHRYQVEIKGLTDEKATEIFGKDTTEVLERAVNGGLKRQEVEVEVTHQGRIDS